MVHSYLGPLGWLERQDRWGLWLLTMVITMRRFPKMVNTYMIRNTAERSLLSSGFFVMPRRMNSVMWIWFAMYPGKLVVVWAPTASYKIWKSNVWFRISDSFTSCISRISGDFFFMYSSSNPLAFNNLQNKELKRELLN